MPSWLRRLAVPHLATRSSGIYQLGKPSLYERGLIVMPLISRYGVVEVVSSRGHQTDVRKASSWRCQSGKAFSTSA